MVNTLQIGVELQEAPIRSNVTERIQESNYHHSSVYAFASQRVYVTSRVSNNQQMVVIGGLEALRAQAQSCNLDAFDLGLGS